MVDAQQIIELFGMRPLSDEGGFYVETHRACERIERSGLPARYDGPRCFSTAILYLLTAESCSRLHRVSSDEIFHFYLGGPVSMLQLPPDGAGRLVTLGSDILNGQQPQVVVQAGTWQGAFVREGADFALIGCTVSPGFEFADYQRADRDELIRIYPDIAELIIRLT